LPQRLSPPPQRGNVGGHGGRAEIEALQNKAENPRNRLALVAKNCLQAFLTEIKNLAGNHQKYNASPQSIKVLATNLTLRGDCPRV
jgi:hypothetical protein